MAPNRFRQREKREVTPFADDSVTSNGPLVVPAEEIPAEWRRVEAPINFTWVGQDELAGMGWPKSRDQVRFLVEQGIDHLLTLSADKIPPHYAFPDLKWSLIPVEDFTGPKMNDIKTFLNIMDDARKNGEAVGVHCAEGRGRTGVMCACYLIYYHDLKPWDAIRIMRRQRPGSVERKVQEDTVVMFYNLLQDYGKHALEDLEEKEKEYKDMLRRQKENDHMANCENILLMHTATFYGPAQRTENKIQRLEKMQRMRRSKSMPKMSQEEEEAQMRELDFRRHIHNFYNDNGRGKSQPRFDAPRTAGKADEASYSASSFEPNGDHYGRAITPARGLKEALKPVSARKMSAATSREVDEGATRDEPDFTKNFKDHFKVFMAGGNSSSSVKRARSFSQPKDKDNSSSGGSSQSRSDASRADLGNAKDGGASVDNSVSASENSHSPAAADATDVSSCSSLSMDSVVSVNSSRSSRSSLHARESKHSGREEEKYVEDREETEKESNAKASSSASIIRRRPKLEESEDAAATTEDEDMNSTASASSSRCNTPGERRRHRPPQPSYTPKYSVDSASTTYSYYTRVRSRAAAAKESAAAAAAAAAAASGSSSSCASSYSTITTCPSATPCTTSASDYASSSRKCSKELGSSQNSLNPARRRAVTVDRDLCVTVTVTESSLGSYYHRPQSKYVRKTSNDTFEPSPLPQTYYASKNDKENMNLRDSGRTGADPASDSQQQQQQQQPRRRVGYRRSRTNPLEKEISAVNEEVSNENHKNKLRSSFGSLSSAASGAAAAREAAAAAVANSGVSGGGSTYATSCSPYASARSSPSPMRRSPFSRAGSSPHRYSSQSYTATAKRWTSSGLDNNKPASCYSPFARDNWKRTNQRFSYSRLMSGQSKETFV